VNSAVNNAPAPVADSSSSAAKLPRNEKPKPNYVPLHKSTDVNLIRSQFANLGFKVIYIKVIKTRFSTALLYSSFQR